jgi:hypothetical protein
MVLVLGVGARPNGDLQVGGYEQQPLIPEERPVFGWETRRSWQSAPCALF